ncbi:putative major capsid protein [Alkaliphilus metalliredigens QYMF]|uniref:Putative major capsid protein n=1 Tax=Alkaliphilus metalliredigens (strain QYMF) TaxID=293826 RepID=A6TQV0_ALKMQ|nr:phage major capsid protein [Alkaliphilus metalliredigens]ABR48568.1 putative major capsid protein [Alkaliphilus metalliredigens QYMF]
MNRDKILAMITKKEARKAELGTKANETEDVKELRGINTELSTLNTEIAELRSLLDSIPEEGQGEQETSEEDEQRSQPLGAAQVVATYGLRQQQSTEGEGKETELKQKYEQRGADLKEKRSVTYDLDEVPELRATTIGSGALVTQTKYSNTVNQGFNEVSRVIDTVNAVPLNGGESYEKAFEVTVGEGDYTSETGDYNETDPVFDYVSINKAKVTAYTELSDEAMKLPNIEYQAMVRSSITKAIRKKISKQILVGNGGANALVGIFNAPEKVIPPASDIEISEIDADTLDNIIINYGGDEEVEGMGYLVLNKRDLAAFAKVRSTDGKKLYKIKTNGNTGTISSEDSFEVPFIINSICPALSDAGTVAESYCMAYGMMKAYEMPVFSALTVEESRDYKFKTGQIAYRGAVWVGGNTAMYKGFVRVKKVTAT